MDFKGWFVLGNQQRRDPLTVCDRYSHFVAACEARPNQQYQSTLHACRGLMRSHGLPKIIRCNLGSPFASPGLGRVSSLSLWWIEHGIEVEFMHPASPQENGAHERMHRDLKAEAIQPPPSIWPHHNAASIAGNTRIITTGRTSRSTSDCRWSFTTPARGASATTTSRWCIRQTRRRYFSGTALTARANRLRVICCTRGSGLLKSIPGGF